MFAKFISLKEYEEYSLGVESIEPVNRIAVRRTYCFREKKFTLDITDVLQQARKYLYRTSDGHVIETGLYEQPVKTWHNRPSIEISSQIGCSIRCIMCASGDLKFLRNLNSQELVAQVLQTKKLAMITQNDIAVSAMGTGETSLNHIQLTEAFNAITELYPGTEYRVATMGANLEALEYWAIKMPEPFQLVPSLHAASPETRKKIIPGSSNPYDFIQAIANFHDLRPASRILIKYIMIKDLNDSDREFDLLCKLIEPVKDFADIQFCVMNPTPCSLVRELVGTATEIINAWILRLQPQMKAKALSLYFIDAKEIACGQTTYRFLTSFK